jgi:hypothetical protein
MMWSRYRTFGDILAAQMTDHKSRFPITLWPATPLSPVLVERWAFLADEHGGIDWRTRLKPSELPEEWVLRQLADADLEDDHALVALLEGYGAITWPYFDPAYVPRDRHALLARLPSADEQRGKWWEHRQDGTLEDARWWLKTARALAGVWTEASAGRDPGPAWATEGFVALEDEKSCWAQFTVALNVGLQPFRAHVEHRVELPRGEQFTWGLPQVGLYSATCRQVFNFIVRGETARRCENETCGHTFVHQLGGAQHGQYRSRGLLRFCSPECARAETQRQYRRRKAAQKKEQP